MSSIAAHAQLEKVFRGKGWIVGVIPAVHVADIRRMLERARAEGVLDEGFYRVELDETFEWDPPPEFPACSIIAAVRPALMHRLVFVRGGEDRVVLIPPTYAGYRRNGEEIRQLISSTLAPFGYRTSAARIPEKTLAVRAGLVRYGRNNITYAPGLGSFAQIASTWSTLPTLDDPWRRPEALGRCANCTACVSACPTGAIREDRFLLHGERCLTHLNEQEGDFPSWLDPGAHNALIGCVRCQLVCPENREFKDQVVEGPVFSEAETDLLLAATPRAGLPEETIGKLDSLEVFWSHEQLCRNLAVLLAP